jgi:hypothetical protein
MVQRPGALAAAWFFVYPSARGWRCGVYAGSRRVRTELAGARSWRYWPARALARSCARRTRPPLAVCVADCFRRCLQYYRASDLVRPSTIAAVLCGRHFGARLSNARLMRKFSEHATPETIVGGYSPGIERAISGHGGCNFGLSCDNQPVASLFSNRNPASSSVSFQNTDETLSVGFFLLFDRKRYGS